MTNSNIQQIVALGNMVANFEAKLPSLHVSLTTQTIGRVAQVSKFPVLVEDINENSVTNGWGIVYTPSINKNGVLSDTAESIHEVRIPEYKKLNAMIIDAHNRFVAGEGVTKPNNQLTSSYDYQGFSVSCFANTNSLSVQVNVTDINSPFYLLTSNFVVMPDKVNPGYLYVTADKVLDRTTDVLTWGDAYLAPKKRRYRSVTNDRFGKEVLSTKDKYIQKMTSIDRHFSAMFDRMIREYAFEVALPMIQEYKQNNQFNQQVNPYGQQFINSYSLTGQQNAGFSYSGVQQPTYTQQNAYVQQAPVQQVPYAQQVPYVQQVPYAQQVPYVQQVPVQQVPYVQQAPVQQVPYAQQQVVTQQVSAPANAPDLTFAEQIAEEMRQKVAVAQIKVDENKGLTNETVDENTEPEELATAE